MTATITFKQANLFAAALDVNDFSSAQALLSKACTYEREQVVIKGPEAIINSYKQSSERAQALFDTVYYTSDVMSSSETTAELLFSDSFTCGEAGHVHRSRQFLEFDQEGAIIRIRHQEIAGEREGLDNFLKECGLSND